MPQIPKPKHDIAYEQMQDWLASQGVQNTSLVDMLKLFTAPENIPFDLAGPAVTIEQGQRMLNTVLEEMAQQQDPILRKAREMAVTTLRDYLPKAEPEVLSKISDIGMLDPITEVINSAAASFSPTSRMPAAALDEVIQSIGDSRAGRLPKLGWAADLPPEWAIKFGRMGGVPLAGLHELGHARHFLSAKPMEEYSKVESLLDADIPLQQLFAKGRTPSSFRTPIKEFADMLTKLIQGAGSLTTKTPENLARISHYYSNPTEAIAQSYATRRMPQMVKSPEDASFALTNLEAIPAELKQQALLQWLMKGPQR